MYLSCFLNVFSENCELLYSVNSHVDYVHTEKRRRVEVANISRHGAGTSELERKMDLLTCLIWGLLD